MQIDNPTHFNRKKEKLNALKLLETAKQLNKKTTFLPKGYSADFERFKKKIRGIK